MPLPTTQDAIDRAARRLMEARCRPHAGLAAAMRRLIDRRYDDPLAGLPIVTAPLVLEPLPDETNGHQGDTLTDQNYSLCPSSEAQTIRQDYPGCSREDLIWLLKMSRQEVEDTTNVIIKATEAAASGDPDRAVKVIARYVLNNGHVREAADVTLGRVANLAGPVPNNPTGFEQALNTWEAAWGDHADHYTGMPNKQDNTEAAQAIRELIAAGHEQFQILQAARTAGATFSADIARHLVRVDQEAS